MWVTNLRGFKKCISKGYLISINKITFDGIRLLLTPLMLHSHDEHHKNDSKR